MTRLALPLALLHMLAAARLTAEAANPVGGSSPADFIGGLADPNLHFFNGTFTLWATHDFSPNDTSSVMKDWWVWSSPDLVAWTEESVVTPACRTECLPSCLPSCPSKPGGVFLFDHSPSLCWATDAAFVNGSYYFYLSAGGSEVGVVTSNSLKGPWRDPLRGVSLMSNVGSVGALLSYGFGGTFSPRAGFRDPCVFHDSSTGEHYLISGVFQYYVMKLAPNMTALAEHPRLLEFTADQPVYGPLGLNQTDDKPFMHKNGDTYYLSWGCFYSTSKSVYGPFTMQGSVISTAKLAPAFRCNGTCGYHGHPSPPPPPPPGPPGPNQCHPSTNQTKNCNVCAECCRDYVPNGAECDKCVKEECKKGVGPSRPLRQPAAKGVKAPTALGWYQGQDYVDRHGSFTQHGKQWYFATNDYSHGTDHFNTGLFRDTVICYIHYRANGTMEPCTIDAVGVGQYDATAGRIEAENFFELLGRGDKIDLDSLGLGFGVSGLGQGSALRFPNVVLPRAYAALTLSLRLASATSAEAGTAAVVARSNSTNRVLGSAPVTHTGSWQRYRLVETPLAVQQEDLDEDGRLDLVLSVEANPEANLDGIRAGMQTEQQHAQLKDGVEVVRLESFELR